ncbi:MAG: hypothetical protein KDB00_07925 [Planctomycetales bacterium]|nr:hypothetical protein [Planctomycetales bacterium]
MIDLLRRCLEDDDGEAWHEFWTIFQEVVLGSVGKLLLSAGYRRDDVDDVTMDIYVRLAESHYRRLKTFRGSDLSQLSHWLRRIGVNSARDWLRANLKHRIRQ